MEYTTDSIRFSFPKKWSMTEVYFSSTGGGLTGEEKNCCTILDMFNLMICFFIGGVLITVKFVVCFP